MVLRVSRQINFTGGSEYELENDLHRCENVLRRMLKWLIPASCIQICKELQSNHSVWFSFKFSYVDYLTTFLITIFQDYGFQAPPHM